jgi:hypothetical protein
MVASGAKMYRLRDDIQSGYEILAELLRTQPAFLKIQKEMASEFEGRPLARTAVGEQVCREIQERITHKKLIEAFKKRLAKGGFEKTPQLEVELGNSLQEAILRLAKYEEDRGGVQKVPTWSETVFNFGRRNAVPTLASVGTHVIQHYSGNAALRASEQRAAQAIAEAAAARGAQGGQRGWELRY